MRYYKECESVLSRLNALNSTASEAIKLALDERVADYHSAFQVERFVVNAAKTRPERWKECIKEIRGKIASLANLAIKIEKEEANRSADKLSELEAMELDMCVAKLLDQRDAIRAELAILVSLAHELEADVPESEEALERQVWLEKLRREITLRKNLQLPVTPDLAELAFALPDSEAKQRLIGHMSHALMCERKEEDEQEAHLIA